MAIPPALTSLQRKRSRRFPKVRFTLLIIGLILIGIGAILWFLSNAQVINAGLFNVLTIIFGVLGLAAGWIFGLFPSPAGETETEPSEPTHVSTNEQKISFQEAQQVQPIQHVETLYQYQYYLQPGQPMPQQPAFHSPIPQLDPNPSTLPSPQENQTARPQSPYDTFVSDQPEECHPQTERSRPDTPLPENVVDYSTSQTNEEEQVAISLVKTCFSELMKWKKSVDLAAYRLFVDGKPLSNDQYRYQYEILERIYNLAANLKSYIEHLPSNSKQRRARLVGTIYDIQATTRTLQLYVTQSNRSTIQGEIQQQFKQLTDHFTRITDDFNELSI